MTTCCNRLSPPHVILAGDRPALPWNLESPCSASMSARLLQVPHSPLTDLRTLLTDLANRQEELFRQVLEQQKQVENQLSSMQLASKTNADAQKDFFSEFYRFLNTSQAVDMAHNGLKTYGGGMSQSGTGEFVGNMNSDTTMQAFDESDAHCHFASGSKLVSEQTYARPLSQQSAQSIESAVAPANSAGHPALKLHNRASVRQPQNDDSWLSRLNYLLKCKEFEFAVAFAIIMNASVMCVECQYQGLGVGFSLQYPGREVEAHIVWAGAEQVFDCCDWLFGILFVLEMLIKILCWRFNYFYVFSSPSEHVKKSRKKKRCWHRLQGWNLLDCFSVLAFLLDKMLPVSAVNPQMLRLLRLFRLFRLIRLLRFLEALDHLYIMTTAIAGLSKVLTWAVVLLTLMLLICNLCLVQILQVTYFDQVTASDLTPESLEKHQKVYQYFGTCTRCMLSMYEITLGNWPPVARLLAEEVSEWFALICILHKLTIGFAVIGVITGVILQETFKVAQTDDIIMFRQKKNASRVLAEKMKTLFETLDMDPDGKLQVSEFTAIGDDPDIKFWLASLDIETDDLTTLFELIDMDGSGYITVDELVTRVPRVRGAARSIDVLSMLRRCLDSNSRRTSQPPSPPSQGLCEY